MKLTRRGNIVYTWWWTLDKYIVAGIALLLVLGVMLVMAASPTVAERIGLTYFHFIKKQILYVIMGVTIISAISFLDPVTTRRLSVLGFVIFFILLIGVDVAGFETKGAKRWIYLAGISIQPSELLKPFFAVLTAWLLTKRNTDKQFPGFTIATIIFGIISVLLIRQPNFGMTLTMGVIWGAQMFIGGLNIILILGMGIAGVIGIFGAYHYLPHVQNRINTFFNTSEAGDNYQTEKSLEAFHNGGVFGTGAGEGVVKQILPDAHTDFIFSVAGEEFGLLFCLGIIAIYGFITFRCIYRAYNDNDLFTLLAVTGLTMQLFFQAVVNMGVATNLLPNTGMTLPFISYGGSSIMSVSLVVGMILSFTKKKFGH